jgi:predicted dehydrogenase
MREMVLAGVIGEAVMVEGNFSHRGGMDLTPDRWRWHRDRCPGGPLMLLGVHHADTMQHILGPVDAVTAMANRVAHPAEIDDVVLSVLRFRRGCLGYLGSSYAIPSVFTLNIFGTEANLYSEGGMNFRVKRKDDPAPVPVPLDPVDTHLMELEGFAKSIREGVDPLVTGEEALLALQVIDAAVRSAESGREEKTKA